MVKDAGYKEEDLQIKNRVDEDGYRNYGTLWEDGVLKSDAIVALYTMDHVGISNTWKFEFYFVIIQKSSLKFIDFPVSTLF